MGEGLSPRSPFVIELILQAFDEQHGSEPCVANSQPL
jgi:hypothetical protein